MSLGDLDRLLSTTVPFLFLSAEARQQVAALLTEETLAAGQVLAHEGEPGNSMYILVEGTLELVKQVEAGPPIRVGLVKPGGVIGELAILTGHPRAASVIAVESSMIASLSRAAFDSLVSQFSAEMQAVTAWMQAQLHHYQIVSALHESGFFRGLPLDAMAALAKRFHWMEVHTGDVLFRQGDLAHDLFLVASGRMRLLRTEAPEIDAGAADNELLMGEFGKGDVLGAVSIVTGELRSATAYAVRDSQLAVLDHGSFNELVAEYPRHILEAFTRRLTSQAWASSRGEGIGTAAPSTFAILLGSPETKGFAAQLAAALAAFGPTLRLEEADLAKHFPARGISSDAAETRLLAWLNDQEARWSRVVYEAEAKPDAWTYRCLRQADVLLVLTEASADPKHVGSIVRSLLDRTHCGAETNLVLLHPEDSEIPLHTQAWLQAFPFKHHWHARLGKVDDVRRIARFLCLRAVGVALGGGLAFGLAHIGVLEALRDLQVPVDYIGGTSMGAIVGIGCALGYPYDQVAEMLREGCTTSLKGDYTLPIVSFLTGRKMAGSVSQYVHEHELEDLWLPYFAISASLVQAQMIVHKRGSALRAVLASSRFPGLFPPLGWDQDVLVDGGLVNNVPCDVMRAELGPGTVIGVDVSRGLDFSVTEQFDLYHSGWQIARRRINPFSPKPQRKSTTMASIMQRIVRLGGVAQLRQIRSTADLYLMPPLHDFGFRDFHRGDEMARVAYDYTTTRMQDWIERHGRPWEGNSSK